MVGPARGPDWTFIELDIPQDGMLTHPELVSNTSLRTRSADKTVSALHGVDVRGNEESRETQKPVRGALSSR